MLKTYSQNPKKSRNFAKQNMNKLEKSNSDNYDLLLTQISTLITDAKRHVTTTINATLVETYWNVGKYIVEFEQEGNVRAKYGDQLSKQIEQ